MEKKDSTGILVECAILVSLSVVLSFIRVWQMPLGGSVTLVSMLPLCLVSLRHGVRWGLRAAFVGSLFQLLQGFVVSGLMGWGLTPSMLAGCIFFDYIFAFTVLGVAGISRHRGRAGILAGITLAVLLRFLSHVVSGIIIFRNLAQWSAFGDTFTASPVLYSVCYNAFYLLPELLLTLLVAGVLARANAEFGIRNSE